MTRSAVRIVRGVLALAAMGLLATCQNETAGPGRRAALAIEATLPAGLDPQAFGLVIDQVRLIAVNALGDTVFDKLFAFPANQTSISLQADVPLAQSPETFQITIQELAGTVLLFSGTQSVSLTVGSGNSPAQVPVTYSGPGQNVATLTLGPLDSILTQGGTLQFRVTAKDGQGASVPNFYVSWTTSDTTVAKVDATGTIKAPLLRKTLNVLAKTPTGVIGSTSVTFVPSLASVAFDSGCGLSGLPGAPLAQPIVARVLGSDGLGVQGVNVTFSAPPTGFVSTPTTLTDTGGRARTLVTLPTAAGPTVFQASVTGLTTASCAQTVSASPPTQLAFTTQPGNVGAGASLGSVQVEVRDASGTLVTGATNQVTIALLANPGGATLAGTKTVNASSGVATFTGLSLDKAGVGYTLTATATGLTSATSSAFNITAGGLAQLAFITQPGNIVAGAPFVPAVQVAGQDAQGNTVTSFANPVTLAFGSHPIGATLGGTVSVGAVSGVATFSTLGLLTVAGGYTLVASAAGVGSRASNSFTVSPGTPKVLAFTVQPRSPLQNAIITPPVRVAVEDTLGNVVDTATNAITMGFAANPGQGPLGGTLTRNAASGLATFTDLSIAIPASGYQLGASATGLTTATSAAFDVLTRPPGVVWVNPAGGNWSNPANWSPARVPGPKDTASIVLPGAYVVTLDVNDTVAFLAVGDTIGGIVMDVPPGRRLFIDSSAVILRAGSVVLAGSDTIGGPGNLTNQGSLTMTGSAITTAGFSNVFVLQVQGTNTITGLFSNSAGGAIFVQGGAASGDGILTFSSGFLNAGVIVLSNGDAAAPHNAVINVTSGTLTNLGLLQSAAVAVGNPPGGRTLHAPLDNQGSVIVQETLTLDQAGAGHANSGVISLSGGNLGVNLSGFRPGFTNLAGGTIDVGPDTLQIVNQSTGTFLNDSGATLLGAGVIDIGTSSFITNGIVTVGETGPAFLGFKGPYTQGPPSELNVFLTSPATPGVTYSQFQVSDNVTIQTGATLTAVLLGPYTSGSYVIMTVPAGKSITSDFTTKNLPINPISGGPCTGSVVGGTQYVITCPP